MSYDVQVWSVEPPDFGDLPPNSARTSDGDAGWSMSRGSWQIVCGAPDRVLPEDIPEEISEQLPGISFVTELVLEPISAPGTARAELQRIANRMAKASHGVVYDRQTDQIVTPRGVKRFVPQRRSDRFSLLELGWWFLGDTLHTKTGMDGLLEILAANCPEALPRRYGLYEPPQFLFSETGHEHLSAFLLDNLETLTVLYPIRPFMSMGISCTKDRQDARLGFRANRLDITCEASVIRQPGWQEGLRRLWLQVCQHLSPFYAEVRTLHGFLPMGATYGSDMKTDVHPVRSWFWRGIPRELGHAVAIGAPYLDHWPRDRAAGGLQGALIVADTGRWEDGNILDIDVPEGIRQRWTPAWKKERYGSAVNWVSEYPAVWPFESGND